jgi:hypothetical protein
MSTSPSPSSDNTETTSASATRAVHTAFHEAGIESDDYSVSSHKAEEGGVVSTVTPNGWAHPGLVALIAEAVKKVEGSPKVKQDGRVYTLTFS